MPGVRQIGGPEHGPLQFSQDALGLPNSPFGADMGHDFRQIPRCENG